MFKKIKIVSPLVIYSCIKRRVLKKPDQNQNTRNNFKAMFFYATAFIALKPRL